MPGYDFVNDTGAHTEIINADEVNTNFDNIQGNFLPLGSNWTNTDNAYDLGSAAFRWRSGYFGGTVTTNNLNASSGSITSFIANSVSTANLSATTANVGTLNASYINSACLRYDSYVWQDMAIQATSGVSISRLEWWGIEYSLNVAGTLTLNCPLHGEGAATFSSIRLTGGLTVTGTVTVSLLFGRMPLDPPPPTFTSVSMTSTSSVISAGGNFSLTIGNIAGLNPIDFSTYSYVAAINIADSGAAGSTFYTPMLTISRYS